MTARLSLREIAKRLETAGTAWCVFAGAAAVAYGSHRVATDVDILVRRAEGDRVAALFPEAKSAWTEGGDVQGLKLTGYDVLFGLDTLDLDDRMAARLRRGEIRGVEVPLIPPEDNILLKAMWRRGQDEGKHDWEDVQAMLANVSDLDWDYLRWRASAYGAGEGTVDVLHKLQESRGRDP